MNLRQFLDELPRGGIARLAASLSISPVYLSQLAARQDGREPSAELAVLIERATGGVVTRRELRPNDYWLIWPEFLPPQPAGTHGR
jgi:DNA-binding transcriptional regulator YdaS (Cro superfamily)